MSKKGSKKLGPIIRRKQAINNYITIIKGIRKLGTILAEEESDPDRLAEQARDQNF